MTCEATLPSPEVVQALALLHEELAVARFRLLGTAERIGDTTFLHLVRLGYSIPAPHKDAMAQIESDRAAIRLAMERDQGEVQEVVEHLFPNRPVTRH
ncbi:hypothetical protein [Lysobacter sp. FW306-1B-D06B]|uniref:hypothetical protein n=1 Tax=Lysobacter sp. FW306-1B-D06B TaxID=3140250 RepID=UPI003140875F